MPIFDMVDKEDSYELKVEVPGIEKEKIKVIATNDSVEIRWTNNRRSIRRQKKEVRIQ